MKESLKELYQNKNTKESDYECRMICIVYCAIQGLPEKYQVSVDVLPTYGGYKEKFKAKVYLDTQNFIHSLATLFTKYMSCSRENVLCLLLSAQGQSQMGTSERTKRQIMV